MGDNETAEGLEDVAVAETRLSRIDGDAGELLLAGFPVGDLAPRATFEETVYLLWNDRLPDADELAAFRADLAARRSLTRETVDLLRAATAEDDAAPMDALRMASAALNLSSGAASGTGPGSAAEDVRRAVAAFPTAVAAFQRLREGAEPVEPREELGHAANYLYMLEGEAPDERRVRGLETYLNAVVDHGLNASTFAARTIVSTESDAFSAVTGAVGALKGPRHGGAPGPVLDMLREVHDSGDPEGYVRETLSAGERLMGFGHRVYRTRDPRAAVLSAAAERFYGGDDAAFFETARETERVAVEALAEHKPDRRLETNVEFYTAVLLNGVGVPRDLFTPTFAVARVGGWTAHCREQLADNRLVRPRARYVGATGRTWTPVAER